MDEYVVPLLLILGVISACSESHGADGGDGDVSLDGSADARDDIAAPPDGPTCIDADGDGFAAASCGGRDCDDGDPAFSPVSSRCVGPDRVERCLDGLAFEEWCPTSSPTCDARIGECASSACGDGVVHESEECDDGASDCRADCTRAPCGSMHDCPAARPLCADRRPDGRVVCRAAIPGGAGQGEPCSTDSDCSSAWCDDDQGRCTQACDAFANCSGRWAFCGTAAENDGEQVCRFGCTGNADCQDDRLCTLYLFPGPQLIPRCRRIGDALPPGAECPPEVAYTCATNVCLGHPIAHCIATCGSDADCDYWVGDVKLSCLLNELPSPFEDFPPMGRCLGTPL